MSNLTFNRELYSKVALLKAAFFFIDKVYIHLDADNKYYYVQIIQKKQDQTVSDTEFMNEMLIQSVRHEVYLQTKNVRELLLARAMSTSLITKKEYVTESETSKKKFSEDKILKDWFDQEDETK